MTVENMANKNPDNNSISGAGNRFRLRLLHDCKPIQRMAPFCHPRIRNILVSKFRDRYTFRILLLDRIAYTHIVFYKLAR